MQSRMFRQLLTWFLEGIAAWELVLFYPQFSFLCSYANMGFRISRVMKLFLDLRRDDGRWGNISIKRVSCVSFLLKLFFSCCVVSSGGTIPTALYSDWRGVGRKISGYYTTGIIQFCTDFLCVARISANSAAVEYGRAKAVVLRVVGSAPQLEFASFESRLFLVATLPFTFFVCSEYNNVISIKRVEMILIGHDKPFS